MASSGGSLLAVRWAEKFCGAIPVVSLTRCRNSPSSIASTQFRTDVGWGGSESRGLGVGAGSLRSTTARSKSMVAIWLTSSQDVGGTGSPRSSAYKSKVDRA